MDDQAQGIPLLGREMLARAAASEVQEFGSLFLSRLLGFDITHKAGSAS